MRFCEKMLTVHIYTIKRSYRRNLVKIGLLDFVVARVRTYIHTYGRTRYSVHAIRASPYRSCTNNRLVNNRRNFQHNQTEANNSRLETS